MPRYMMFIRRSEEHRNQRVPDGLYEADESAAPASTAASEAASS